MGSVGVTGTSAANLLAEQADVVLAVGSRLQDFTTGSWALFKDDGVRRSSGSTRSPSMPASTARCRWSPTRKRGLEALEARLGDWKAADAWIATAKAAKDDWLQGREGRDRPDQRRCRRTRR